MDHTAVVVTEEILDLHEEEEKTEAELVLILQDVEAQQEALLKQTMGNAF